MGRHDWAMAPKPKRLSEPSFSALHYLQLYPAQNASRYRSGAGNARPATRKSGFVVWIRLTGYMIICIPLYDIKAGR